MPVKNVEVVKLQQSLDFIFNVVLSILYVHRVHFVNFLHKLYKLNGDQFDHLFNRSADILITRTYVRLGDWATFLEHLVEDFGLVLDVSRTIQNGKQDQIVGINHSFFVLENRGVYQFTDL